MTDPIAFRSAQPEDVAFCEALYFESMGSIIEALALDMGQQQESFANQWKLSEVRIVKVGSVEVGWLQTTQTDDAVVLGQLYLAASSRGRGIGTRVVQSVIEEAARGGKAVSLSVVKINPARRLYARLGFRVTHEDRHKLYMRRNPQSR